MSLFKTKFQNYNSFNYIENEFFKIDKITFNKIANLYCKIYGYGPYKYMIETYDDWKTGKVTPTRQSMHKIYQCVPRFLSDEKKFVILKNEIISYLEIIHRRHFAKSISYSEINTLYINYLNEVSNFDKSNIPYLMGEGIFNKSEIDQFINICKFILIEKIKSNYDLVYNDLQTIKTKLSFFKYGLFEASYKIQFNGTHVNLSDIYEEKIGKFNYEQNLVDIDGRYKDFIDKFIFEEIFDGIDENYKMMYSIKSSELDNFILDYHKSKSEDQENKNLTFFVGEAGVLTILIEINGKIIRDEVERFISTIHKKQDKKVKRLSDIDSLFESFLEKIALFNDNNLSFLKNRKLNEDKILQFIQLSQFSLLEKLNLAQHQTKKDLLLIKNMLTDISTGIFSGSYVIDFLNVTIDISDINEIEINLNRNYQLEINLSESYKLFADTYILEEFMLKSFNEKMGRIENFVISQDLETFINNYFELQSKNIESNLNAEFKGEGGYLKLIFVSKSILILKKNLFILILKAIIFILMSIFVAFLFLFFKLYKFLPFSIIFAIFFISYFIERIKDYFISIKISNIELKKYGQ